jgi:ethanolamine utilization protein EutP (predicted NTPase)
VIDLRAELFAHGQLYTALTRFRRRGDVKVFLPNVEDEVEYEAKNIVYRRMLYVP